MPEDEADLAYFLAHLPAEIPVTVIGLGSNLIVRDGGVPGVVIRLGRGFSDGHDRAGRARARRRGGAGRESRARRAGGRHRRPAFLRGIPGAIGGALRMNGGAYGRETKDALVEARGVDRQGRLHALSERRHALHLSPLRRARRHHLHRGGVPGAPGDPAAISAEMDKITESREATQPIKSRTGGSTFKNPPGQKAWQLIDAAGCRGLTRSATRRCRRCTATS